MPVIPFSSAPKISEYERKRAERQEEEDARLERERLDAKLKELRGQRVKTFDPQGGTPMINIPERDMTSPGARLNPRGVETPNPYSEPGVIDQSNYQPQEGDALWGQFEQDRTKRASPDEQVMWTGGDSENGVGGPDNPVLSPEIMAKVIARKQELDQESDSLKVRGAVATANPNPDQAAAALDLANKTGANRLDVETNLKTYQQSDLASKIERMGKTAPKFRAWLDDPVNLDVAHDDVDNLSWWETAGRMAWNTPGALYASAVGFWQSTVGLGSMGAEGADEMGRSPSPALAAIFGNPGEANRIARKLNEAGSGTLPRDPTALTAQLSDALSSYSNELYQYKNSVTPVGKSDIESGYYSGVVSMGTQAPLIAAAVITKNPALATGGMTAVTAGEAFAGPVPSILK